MSDILDLSEFKDPQLARRLADNIAALVPESGATLMEVCGTHTVSIARAGLRTLMPENVRLISGPGCPVCVTANRDIDRIIALSRIDGVITATFGDMVRVPGSSSTLAKEKAAGADVRVIYSPLDALRIAAENPDKQVVFVGVGFETTTPLTAAVIKQAAGQGLKNFSVLCAHKNVPHALDVIVSDPEVQLDAFILPGHVSTIIGERPYRFLAEKYGIPGVITGFEPVDILQGIAMLIRQLAQGEAKIEIAYRRGVHEEGNTVALTLMDEVFEECDSQWRGLGVITGSGFRIRKEFSDFDALLRFDPEVEPTVEPKGCRCGDVLRGIIPPDKCPLFDHGCSPEHPIGPCMVSSEGSCAAYYRYRPV